jgi:hypothetical protein
MNLNDFEMLTNLSNNAEKVAHKGKSILDFQYVS